MRYQIAAVPYIIDKSPGNQQLSPVCVYLSSFIRDTHICVRLSSTLSYYLSHIHNGFRCQIFHTRSALACHIFFEEERHLRPSHHFCTVKPSWLR
jgi:hypothetical protein